MADASLELPPLARVSWREARSAVLALRLSTMTAVGYELIYQYCVAGLATHALPLVVLSMWLLIESVAWVGGVFLISAAMPRGVSEADRSRPLAIRLLAVIGTGLLVAFLAAQYGRIDDDYGQVASVLYLVVRAVTIWLVGDEFLRLARYLPAHIDLAAPIYTVRRLLILSLILWIIGWTAAIIGGPLWLDLADHPSRAKAVAMTCSSAEWLLVGAGFGVFVVLGRLLRVLTLVVAQSDQTPAARLPMA